MIEYLDTEVRGWLERKGIEEDVMSHRDGNLYIEMDDLEEAFTLRSLMADFHDCKLIAHPIKPIPVLEVFGVMVNNFLTKP